MKFFKKVLSAALATTMLFSSFAVCTSSVSAAPSISAGWNETLYAEWADSNPDSDAVKVGYKLSSDTNFTYLSGNDLTYLVRPASTSGYGRVDIPGLRAGRYDIEITASDGTVHTRKGIKVYEYDRSGYAHFDRASTDTSYTGVGAYNDDGTLKSNALVVYVTEENKDTVEVPGYEGRSYDYHSNSFNVDYTRTCEGVGNILNNNMKFIQEVTITDNHPLVLRFIGRVTPPKNLTPYNTKTPDLGGSKGDNGNLAITKYGRNITIEGIGDDATIDGWGFTFSQTSTCPVEAGKSFEVRNLTFKNYTEDGLGFQGDDALTCPIERVWVHHNVFYPGYCANPTASDKSEGDGSCDFKRGQYYTMAYNHYIKCHKTNLIGAGDNDDQFYSTLHHNWYEDVASRQPLAAGGNLHIYNTYFQDTGSSKKHNTSQIIDLRGKASCFSENNYFDNCKNTYNSRKATSYIKTYGDMLVADSFSDEIKGKMVAATTRAQAGPGDNGLAMPDGGSIANWDTNPKYMYCDAAGNSLVSVLNATEDVPEYVKTYAGTLHAFPETESGEIQISVTSGGSAVTDAVVTANGLTFKNGGNGTYTATASLGAEYTITVSKEGYSNVVIKSDVINTDGEVFKATADLKPDYDGFAVVKLVGGADNAPVKGATVTLDDGTALIDQNDGTYKSANQLALGERTVTITNTGDYVAPTVSQKIVIKTTDEATEIHLDKIKGAVSVTLTAAADETQAFDASSAVIYVGSTQLTNSGNGVFTGNVDINTPYDVYINLSGWKIDSLNPSTLTASKSGVANADAVMRYKGQLFTWNYTDDTNTEDFFNLGTLSNWSSAGKNVQYYDGEELTKAVKVNSSFNITFEAPADGELALVMEASKGGSVYLNDVSYEIKTGTNIIPVKAGLNTLKKNKTETHLYLLQYSAGEIGPTPNPPTPGTTETTEATTETTTEVVTSEPTTFDSTPVALGDAVTNNGNSGISVTYDAATDTWKLADTSDTEAAQLRLPFAAPITSGKVVVSGTAAPTKAAGSWALVKITGSANATGYDDAAALATDGNKNITLRVNGDKNSGITKSTNTVSPNKTYNYQFIIDMDAKTATLSIDGTEYVGTMPITATEITGIEAITAVSDTTRNLTISNPYIGIINDNPVPAGLTDEIMWDTSVDLVEGNGLTMGSPFLNNMEENGPVDFVENGVTYKIENWVQPKVNPKDSRGLAPMSPGTPETGGPTGIPVTGGFLKFVPEQDGVFTTAVKTNAGKVTYVTDETGAVVTKLDNVDGNGSSYDVVRFNVAAGKTYYLFANGSNACFYYLGYTPDGDTPGPQPSKVYGDANADTKVDANDVVMVMQYVLNGTPYTNDTEYVDVNKDGKVDSEDAAMILQRALNDAYTLPR